MNASRRRLSALLLLLAAACAGARPNAGAPGASPAAEREVVETVERMFAGMRTRDTALMRSLVDGNARLIGTRMRDGQPFVTPPITMAEFIANVGKATGDAWNERIYDAEARVSDNLATVWTKYAFHVGERVSHCGVDAFQLARTAAGWKIVALADTRRREGCPRRGGN